MGEYLDKFGTGTSSSLGNIRESSQKFPKTGVVTGKTFFREYRGSIKEEESGEILGKIPQIFPDNQGGDGENILGI